jgi:hypothetical protein
MRRCNWKIRIIAMAMLCICVSAQAALPNETSSPLVAECAVAQAVPVDTDSELEKRADTDGIKVPEPQGLLFVAMAICGLAAIHFRRRWG